MLGLDYKKYRRLCWNIKSQTKKLLNSGVQGRLLSPLKHREEMRVKLPREVVDSVIFEASKRRPRKDDPKPFDEWYVTPNRNRMMLLRNDYVTIRIFPRSGTCRVLPSKPMPYEWVQIAVQNAFFKAGIDLDISEKVGKSIEPSRKHRIFKVGPVTPFKIGHYRKSLGLTILADGTHPDFIETEEDFPSWIKPLLAAIAGNTKALDVLSKGQIQLTEILPGKLELIVSRFEKSMKKHLEIIDVFRRESEARSVQNTEALERISRVEKVLVTLVEALRKKKRKRRRRSRKPKPKSRWQKLRKKLRI